MGVTEVGREEIAENIRNDGGGLRISAINIGDDDTAFASTQDSLVSEIDFNGGLTTSRTGTTMSIQASFVNVPAEGSEATVLEAGMVAQDDPTNDTQSSLNTNDVQISRQVVPQVNLLYNDKLDVTFELDVQNQSN